MAVTNSFRELGRVTSGQLLLFNYNVIITAAMQFAKAHCGSLRRSLAGEFNLFKMGHCLELTESLVNLSRGQSSQPVATEVFDIERCHHGTVNDRSADGCVIDS